MMRIMAFYASNLKRKRQIYASRPHLQYDSSFVGTGAMGFPFTMQAQNILDFWFNELSPKQHFVKDAVLDQFSRNIYRDTARALAQDSLALVLAQELVACGQDHSLAETQRVFAYITASSLRCIRGPLRCLRSRA
jgi:hypothetical protein